MEQFNVLAREFDVRGGLFLEASAGTGKTFAIEHLVLRLLLEGEAPLSIDQVLVVTFTRAATRELKLRIRLNIEKAKGALEGGSSEWDYLQSIIDQGGEVLRGAVSRLDEALVRFDEAAIYTIHGFCHKVLTEGAFDARVGFDLSEPEASSHLSLMQQTLLDALRSQLVPPEFSSRQLGHLLSRSNGDPAKLALDVQRLIEKDKEISREESFAELHTAFNQRVEVLDATSARALADFQALAPCYKYMTNKEFPKQMDALAAILDKGGAEEGEFDELLKGKEFFLEKMVGANQKVRAKMPERESLNYPGLVERLQREILPIIERGRDPKRLLLQLAHRSKERWLTFFEQYELLPPDEMLKKTEEALRDPVFLSRIKERYRAVIIDEFQDTDPVQFRIVKQLIQEGGPAVYLVGDPKQSIYGFRKADVYTYLEASTLLSKERHFVLGTNYRSDPALIHALNTLFSHSKRWMPLPTHQSAMEYQAVLPPLQKEDTPIGDVKGAVHCLMTHGELGREKSWPTKEVEREVFLPYLCHEVEKLHIRDGIPFDQIAVLVKDRFQAERVKEAFKQSSIPAMLKRRESAQHAQARAPLIEVLEGCLRPDDPSSLKRALASPLFGWTAKELQDRERVYRVKPLFYALREEWNRRGIGALCHKLLQAKNEGRRILDGILERREQALLSSLQGFVSVLVQKEQAERLFPHELLDFVKKGLDLLSVEVSLPPSHAGGGVQIMTLHMSKGLEFEIVFALGLCSRHMHLEEFAIEGDFIRPSEELVGAYFETDAEKLRQLYVALTRAKRRVYIPLPLEQSGKPPQKGTASPIELFCAQLLSEEGECEIERLYDDYLPLSEEALSPLLAQLKGACSLTFESIDSTLSYEVLSSDANAAERKLPTPVPLSLSVEPILSFSALSKKGDKFFEAGEYREELSPHGIPLGAETGVVLHHIYEQIFAKGLFDANGVRRLIEEDTDATPLSKWNEVIFEMVMETLQMPIHASGATFSLIDLEPGHVLQEIEFLYPTNDGYLKGFIDLAFEKDGKYYVLDWKSNYLGPDDAAYSVERMHQCMEDHDYFLQASIYAEGLKKYLAHFDSRPFEETFGGALYLFLRGRKTYHTLLS